ncbi:hypothetical protein JRQ81_004634 [Phrynocephalus forsythii]|uniref:RING-type E3 ubiquitin transferase n=1 Tax=Phrynocephalus forsythii TaxID=171643 RepID=A0A9Q0XFI1_9SAUR|nr:hypothetical protein JRQ81_004634 [Phrynocephalus forsythii]
MGAPGLCSTSSVVSASVLLFLLHLSFVGATTAGTCLNGGTHDGVKCICPPPFYGPHCEQGGPPPTEAPPAPAKSTTSTAGASSSSSSSSSSPAPCQNGGHSNGSHCVCLPGYWGASCELFDTKECQNGGIWVATACQCPQYFWGARCEFVVNVIEVNTEVEAWLDMVVKVINRNFTEELADSSSTDYKDFVQEFTRQVEEAYRKVPEYHCVTVLGLRPGSVMVHHRVHMTLPLSTRVHEGLQNVSSQLVGLLSEAAQGQALCKASSDLCFEASSIQTSEGVVRVDEKEICRGPIPDEFRPFFSVRPTEGGFECITQCAKGHPGALDCKHGRCQVPRFGPQCHCPETDVSWFLGDQCNLQISKVGLSIGLPLAVTLAVAVILAVGSRLPSDGRQPRSGHPMAKAAKAPSLAEALASGFLTCAICLERLRRPKILPCLHTYCHPCLQELAEGGGQARALRCPECRQEVPLPPGGVDGLKANFFIQGLLDLVGPAGKARPTCSLCPLVGRSAGRPAASRCLDCGDDMCQACARGHRCSRLTHAHRVVDMEGFLSGKYHEEVRQRQASRCKEHVGEELRFFCAPCAAAVCRECRLGPHLQHQPCLSLAEAAKERRPVIVGLLAGVEETVQRVSRGRARLEEEMRALEARGAALRDAVEQTGSRVVAQVLAQQEEVLAQLSDYLERQKKAAETLRWELEFQEQVASSTVAFAQKVLSLGRETEILPLEQLISERLRQLRDFSWEPLATPQPQLETSPDLQSTGSLFRLTFKEEEEPAGRRPEEEKEQRTTQGAKEQQLPPALPSPPAPPKDTLGQEGLPSEGPETHVGAPVPPLPAQGPKAPLLLPQPIFSCSFWVKTPTDKKRPQVTGLCPYGPGEILVADEQNRRLKRFSLQGDFKGTVPVPSEVAPFSVAAVGSKVAFTAGSQLYLLNGEGGLVWRKALKRGQASHALTALGGDSLAVSVAGHVQVYDLEGRLVEKVVPEGTRERCLVFLAGRKGGFVGSDWSQRHVVLFSRKGELVAEYQEDQLSACQPGAVCADAVGTVYVVLREQNKVVAFSEQGEELGPFLTASNGLDRPRVATVAGDGRFVVALSNGTVHVFKISPVRPVLALGLLNVYEEDCPSVPNTLMGLLNQAMGGGSSLNQEPQQQSPPPPAACSKTTAQRGVQRCRAYGQAWPPPRPGGLVENKPGESGGGSRGPDGRPAAGMSVPSGKRRARLGGAAPTPVSHGRHGAGGGREAVVGGEEGQRGGAAAKPSPSCRTKALPEPNGETLDGGPFGSAS